jgi:hypothetical protein
MSEDREATPCCGRHSRPEQECDRYPACDACQHLIADESPTANEVSQRVEETFGRTEFDSSPQVETVRDPLY